MVEILLLRAFRIQLDTRHSIVPDFRPFYVQHVLFNEICSNPFYREPYGVTIYINIYTHVCVCMYMYYTYIEIYSLYIPCAYMCFRFVIYMNIQGEANIALQL